MNHSSRMSLVFVFLSVTLACSSCGSRKVSESKQLPEAGVVHKKVICSGNQDLSYALYIPWATVASATPKTGTATPPAPSQTGRGADGKVLFPVMIAFDPHGDGVLPLTKYKDLAEKYGYILIGSNDSQNGQAGEVTDGIIRGLLAEIHTVYPIDTNRIYVAGFSGGSRVAAMAAMSHKEVKGVIGCGAGFPGGNQPPLYKFDYFGIAGTADFNMNEMLQLDGVLTQLGMRHFIATFPGPHAWPTSSVMEEGFQWLTLNAMRDGTLQRDDAVIAAIMGGFDARIARLKSENYLVSAAERCREAIEFAGGFIPTDHFIQELKSIEQLPEYNKQVVYHTNILKKEEDEQKSLMNAIFSQDEAWWKKRIEAMDSRHMRGLNPEDTLMNARLKAFLSLMCYSNASGAIRQRNREVANTVINIYELADPPNPEPNYMRAVVLLQRYDTTAAIRQLDIAIGKGFSDKNRMIQQSEFQMIKNSPAWFDLLQKMK